MVKSLTDDGSETNEGSQYVHDVGWGRSGKTVCGKDYQGGKLRVTYCLGRVTCPDCKDGRCI